MPGAGRCFLWQQTGPVREGSRRWLWDGRGFFAAVCGTGLTNDILLLVLQIGSLEHYYHFYHSKTFKRSTLSSRGPHTFLRMDPQVPSGPPGRTRPEGVVGFSLWVCGSEKGWMADVHAILGSPWFSVPSLGTTRRP